MNNLTLAYLCNDLKNAPDYRIDGSKCYYNDEFIGIVKEETKDNIHDIYFYPVKPVESININIIINNR